MRILIVTDAWAPQVNGVVTTIVNTIRELRGRSATRSDWSRPRASGRFPARPIPRSASRWPRARARTRRLIDEFAPDAIHIATEGPLGLAARRHCLATDCRSRPPTTRSFPSTCTRAAGCRSRVTYRWMRWFHAPADGLPGANARHSPAPRGARLHATSRPGRAASTPSSSARRRGNGRDRAARSSSTSGRVAVEKNLEAFLRSTCRARNGSSATARRARTSRPIPGGAILHGMKHRRGTRALLPAGRRVRLPQPHRHVRARAARGDGLRDAGGRVSRDRSDRRRPRPRGRRSRERSRTTQRLAALSLDRGEVRRYALQYSWRAATDQFVANLAARDFPRRRASPPTELRKAEFPVRSFPDCGFEG